MGEDDSDDFEEEMESLIEKLSQIVHIFNKLLGFLLGDELVKLFYAASMVAILIILIRFCLCRREKKPATKKSSKEGDNGGSLDSSPASDDRQTLGWFSKYRFNLGLEC